MLHSQVFLLLWKIILISRRNYIGILLTYLVPLTCCIVIVLIRALGTQAYITDRRTYKEFSIDMGLTRISRRHLIEVVMVPGDCVECATIVREALRTIELATQPRLVLMPSESDMERYEAGQLNNKWLVGIVFDNLENFTQYSLKIRVRPRLRKARWSSLLRGQIWSYQTNYLYNYHYEFRKQHYNPYHMYMGMPGYYQEGILALQFALLNKINELSDVYLDVYNITSSKYNVKLVMQRLSEERLMTDINMQTVTLPLVINICFMFGILEFTRAIADETSLKLKEMMKMAGMTMTSYWLAWVIFAFLMLIGICFLLMLTLKSQFFYTGMRVSFFPKTDALLLFFILLAYIASLITTSCFLSCLFKEAKLILLITAVIFITTSLIPALCNFENFNSVILIVLYIFPNIALGIAVDMLFKMESFGEGCNWTNFDDYSRFSGCTVKNAMIALAIDTLVYMILAVYFESVLSTNYNVPKPWHWWITTWFTKHTVIDVEPTVPSDEFFETEPTGTCGIMAMHLYRSSKHGYSVKDFTLNVYQEQITVIMGHVNSGQATAVRLLTGTLPITQGKAIINGYSLTQNMSMVRKSLGFCAQYNLLFDDLTVGEHIYLYARLRGLTSNEAIRDVKYYIEKLKLFEYKNMRCSELSVAIKRAVCLAMAFCGSPQIVILEDPTSGMDCILRQSAWHLVLSEKHGRTILITTRDLKEVEVLAERIVVMRGGEIVSCGSSKFLTTAYKLFGYNLLLTKDENFNPDLVDRFVKTYVPGRVLLHNRPDSVRYHLPIGNVDRLKRMLKRMCDNLNKLGIQQPFIRRIGVTDLYDAVYYPRSGRPPFNDSQSNQLVPLVVQKYRRTNTRFYIFRAMWWKNYCLMKNFPVLIFLKILIVIVFCITSKQFAEEYHLHLLPIEETFYVYNPIVLMEHDRGIILKERPIEMQKILKLRNVEILKVSKSVDNFYMMLQQDKPAMAKMKILYGLQYLSNNVVKCWFNGFYLHSPLLCANMLSSRACKQVDFHPFAYREEIPVENLSIAFENGSHRAVMQMYFMSCLSALYLYTYIKEKPFKQYQIVSGVKSFWYWSAALTWDLFTYLLIVGCIAVFIFATELEEQIILHLLFAGFSFMCLNYVLSFLFDEPTYAFLTMQVFTFFMLLINIGLNADIEEDIHSTFWYGLMSPYFLFAVSMYSSYVNRFMQKICSFELKHCVQQLVPIVPAGIAGLSSDSKEEKCWKFICKETGRCCDKEYEDFQWTLMVMAEYLFSAFFYLLLLTLMESRVHVPWCQRRSIQATADTSSVIREKNKVRRLSTDDMSLFAAVMRNGLKKRRNQWLINGICFAINHKECTVFLGLNQSGKGCLVSMMTGYTRLDFGGCWLNGMPIHSVAYRNLGISFSSRDTTGVPDLTVEQYLVLMCLVEHYSYKDAKRIVFEVASDFEVDIYLKRKLPDLSHNILRRVQNLAALLSQPKFTIFESPTIGVDKRGTMIFWRNIKELTKRNTGVFVTTSSVKESEILSQRLAVLVQGNLVFIGSFYSPTVNLAKKITVVIRVRRNVLRRLWDCRERIWEFVELSLPNVMTRFVGVDILCFTIDDSLTNRITAFNVIEEAFIRFPLEHYMIYTYHLGEELQHAMEIGVVDI